MGPSNGHLITRIGFPLCHACDENCHPKATLGVSGEFQVSAELYVLRDPLRLRLKYIADVKEFIVARRFETVSLHHVLQGFSATDCDWLIPRGAPGYHGRVPVTDSLKRRELLEEFMFWYFDSFVIPLIKVRGGLMT